MRVAVVDHGAGNLRSVVRALRHVGVDPVLCSTPEQVAGADRLVVPGQGAFADCMTRLRAAGLDAAILEHIAAGRPYLGICLGLQVLFDSGLEHGSHAGLGVFRGEVRRLPNGPGVKIPHMGWNAVHGTADLPAFAGLPDRTWYYFVHSYHAVPAEALPVAMATHGIPFVAAVQRDNVLACQFHPEKSQRAGLALLEAFLR